MANYNDYGEMMAIMSANKASNKGNVSNKPSSMGRLINAKTLMMAAFRNEPDCQNAAYVTVVRGRRGAVEDGTTALSSTTVTKIPHQKPRIWEQFVYCLPDRFDGKISKAPGVVVSCSCPRWLYKWEYSCYRHGCADIIYGNGDPPVHTNPSLKLGTCKHLAKVLQYIISRSL